MTPSTYCSQRRRLSYCPGKRSVSFLKDGRRNWARVWGMQVHESTTSQYSIGFPEASMFARFIPIGIAQH
jgi:hypothetical protein